MQLNKTVLHKQPFSSIRSSSGLLGSVCGNSLLFTGKNGVFASGSEKDSNGLYLLLLVYVHCFCIPVLPLILNVLSRYERNIWSVCVENVHVHSSENMSCVGNKDYLSILPFLLKEQIELNLIHRHQY